MSFKCGKHWDLNKVAKYTFQIQQKASPQLHWHQHNQYVIHSTYQIPQMFIIMRVDIIKVCSRILFNGGYCQKATRRHDLNSNFSDQTLQITLFMYKWGMRSYQNQNYFHKKLAAKKSFQCKKQKIRLG